MMSSGNDEAARAFSRGFRACGLGEGRRTHPRSFRECNAGAREGAAEASVFRLAAAFGRRTRFGGPVKRDEDGFMVDTIDMVETALEREIVRARARRDRWFESSKNDIRLALSLNSRIGVLGIEIEEAKEAIASDDPARAVRALYALRRYEDNEICSSRPDRLP
jgi:hypothetical protein